MKRIGEPYPLFPFERPVRSRVQDTDPLPLTDRLHEAVRHHPAMRAAVGIIAMLIRSDTVPDDDPENCQRAADLLLELGEATLLCRLAHTSPRHFLLAVGANEHRARVLADIGSSWPPDTPVSIQLSTAMPAAGLHALHTFLRGPALHGLHVAADSAPPPDALTALRDALRELRPWELTLSSPPGPITPEVIEALHGIQAHTLRLRTALPDRTPSAQTVEALCTLVGSSTARSLDLAVPSMSAALAKRLLACASHWERVALCEHNSTAWGSGPPTIDQLEVDALPFHADLLECLNDSRVKTFVTHGPVDLACIAEQWSPSTSLQRIEASFFIARDEDVDRMLDALSRSQRFVEICHRPSDRKVDGFKPISDDAAARLAAWRSAGHHGAVPNFSLSQWLAEHTVRTVGNFLRPEHTVDALIHFLNSPDNTLIPARQRLTVDPNARDLFSKLQCLIHAEMPDALMRRTLSQLLREVSEPIMDRYVCTTLIVARHLRLRHSDAYWLRLGHTFVTRWVSDRLTLDGAPMSDILDKISPPRAQPPGPQPPASKATKTRSRPPAPARAIDLVIPAGQAGVDALIRQLRVAIPVGHPHFDNLVSARAAILQMLANPGHQVVAGLTEGPRAELARQLLELGQGKLLLHALPCHTRWRLPVHTAIAATTLGHLTAWPDPAIDGHLQVLSSLPCAALVSLARFASQVAPNALQLSISAVPNNDAAAWSALARWVKAHPGLTLELQPVAGIPLPAEEVLAFLTELQQARIGKLVLFQLDVDKPVAKAMGQAIHGMAVAQLELIDCGDDLAREAMVDHPWDRLQVDITGPVHAAFRAGAVTARSLRLRVQDRTDPRWIADIVGECQQLEQVAVSDGLVDILTMAQGLDRNRSVHTVRAGFMTFDLEEEKQARALLRKNNSLLRIDVITPRIPPSQTECLRLEEETEHALVALAVHNGLLQPAQLAIGAAKGFAWNQGRALGLVDVFVDAGERIGRHLDAASALALSATSKAAFLGSRQPWQIEIRALVDLLAPTATLDDLSAHLSKLLRSNVVSGSLPDSSDSTHLLTKVLGMLAAGLPAEIIGHAIGRRLHLLLANAGTLDAPREGNVEAVRELLEAQAYIGVIPYRCWLRDALGIDAPDDPA